MVAGSPLMPAIGYRTWRIERIHGEMGVWLVSPYCPAYWPRSERLEAVCRREPGEVMKRRVLQPHQQEPDCAPPVAGCGCGIYAYHDVEPMLGSIHEHSVGGAVLCWGRVTIHPEVIRVQFARPIALCLPVPSYPNCGVEPEAKRVADTYGVPLVEAGYLAAYASEFGDSYRPASAEACDASGHFRASGLRNFLRKLIDV